MGTLAKRGTPHASAALRASEPRESRTGQYFIGDRSEEEVKEDTNTIHSADKHTNIDNKQRRKEERERVLLTAETYICRGKRLTVGKTVETKITRLLKDQRVTRTSSSACAACSYPRAPLRKLVVLGVVLNRHQ